MSRTRRLLAALAIGGSLAAHPAAAADARDLVSLYVRTCLAYPGDVRALREAFARLELRRLPDVRMMRPGEAFDAGRGVQLRSYANTWCEARASGVDRAALVAFLEDALRRQGIAYRMLDDRPYQSDPARRVRIYATVRSGRRLTVWLGTWPAPGPGVAAALALIPRE